MAGDELFVQIYPALRRFAGAVRPAGVEADDLVQEAVARALRIRPLEEYSHLEGYLRRAIFNLAANERRALTRRDRAMSSTGAPDDATDTYPSDLDQLRSIAPVDRAILFLTLVEGYSLREVAKIIGRSEVAVRARSSRALARLRRSIEDGYRYV